MKTNDFQCFFNAFHDQPAFPSLLNPFVFNENTFIFNNNRPSHVEKAECVKVCCYREDREGANFESNQKNNLCFPKPKDIEDCKELQANQQFINAENYYEDTTCKYHIYNT